MSKKATTNYKYDFDFSKEQEPDDSDSEYEEFDPEEKDVKSNSRYMKRKGQKKKQKKKSEEMTMNKVILDEPGHFLPLPSTKERKCYFFNGAAGSGKTFTASKIIAMHKQALYPEHKVYVFSEVEKDKVVDELNPERVKIDASWIESPPDPQYFKDCVCFFDDVDAISDKEIKEAVMDFRRQLLNMGRHRKVFVFCTNHALTGGRETSDMIRESHFILFFPGLNPKAKIKKFMIDNMGIEKAKAEYMLHPDRKSRWIMISKEAPMYCMTENELFSLTE